MEKKIIQKKKSQINATVPPWIKKRCVYIKDNDDDFGSVSDIVTVALSAFFERYDIIKEEMKKSDEENLKELIKKILFENTKVQEE